MKAVLLVAAAGAVAVASPLVAQKPEPKKDSSCTSSAGKTECRMYWQGAPGDSAFRKMFMRMDSVSANRPALGIELRATGTKRDTLGVFVEAVTPKGPAEAAGIVEGDRIAAINGVDLRSSAADIDDPYTNGLASHRLSREVQKLSPGSRVTLRVYSGGRFRDVQVVAARAADVMRYSNRFNFRGIGPEGMFQFGGPGGPTPEMMMFRPPMLERYGPSAIRLRTPMKLRELGPAKVPSVIRMKRSGGQPLRVLDGNIITLDAPEAAQLDDDDYGVSIDPDEWLDTYDDLDIYNDMDGDFEAPVFVEEPVKPLS